MKKRVKQFFATLLCAVMVMTSVTSAFTDVSSSHWAYNSVNNMYEKGVISGFEDGSFRPDEAVSREQFAKMLVSKSDKTTIIETLFFH